MAPAQGPWLFGDWSIVDAFFAPVALRFDGYAMDLPELATQYVNAWLADADLRAWRDAGIAESWVIHHEEAGV
jgi:glutathione S-transferase